MGIGFDQDTGGLGLMFAVKYSRHNKEEVDQQKVEAMVDPTNR